MNAVKEVERWLRDGGRTPGEATLARYILARLEEAYPARKDSEVAGEPPSHSWIYRAARELALSRLNPPTRRPSKSCSSECTGGRCCEEKYP